jgi:serine/threonine protein kinase
MSMLKNENVARVFGATETDTHMLLVMEYVKHGSFIDFMGKCHSYGPRIILPMALLMEFCADFVRGN